MKTKLERFIFTAVDVMAGIVFGSIVLYYFIGVSKDKIPYVVAVMILYKLIK